MESSVFFKSQMSEKDYLYDFNTKQLTIVDPIVESLFNLDRQGKELSLFAVEHILSQKKSINAKEFNYNKKKYQYLKEYGFFNSLSDKCLFPTFSPEVVKDRILETLQIIFEVTDSCNLNCKYCGYGDMYNNHDRRNTKDIDLQSAIILLDFFIKGWKEKGINMFKVPALFIPKLIVDYLIVVGLNAVACRRCRFLGTLLQMIITPGQGCQ